MPRVARIVRSGFKVPQGKYSIKSLFGRFTRDKNHIHSYSNVHGSKKNLPEGDFYVKGSDEKKLTRVSSGCEDYGHQAAPCDPDYPLEL